jgi:hypothetical protein
VLVLYLSIVMFCIVYVTTDEYAVTGTFITGSAYR